MGYVLFQRNTSATREQTREGTRQCVQKMRKAQDCLALHRPSRVVFVFFNIARNFL